MKFEGIEIALEGIWYEDSFRYFFLPFPSPAHRFSAVVFIPDTVPTSAISIPSNFTFFKSLCGGESRSFLKQFKTFAVRVLSDLKILGFASYFYIL
jgi:hypothetical protein